MEGLIFGEKFVLENLLGLLIVRRQIMKKNVLLCCFWVANYFVFEANFQGTYLSRGGLYLELQFNRGYFCITSFGGLVGIWRGL